MKISVVIPFYKEIDLIYRAVESVVNNSNSIGLSALEIIICNDGMIPNAVIEREICIFSNVVKVISNDSGIRGAGFARNVAIDNSTGDYVAFLDADDYWLDGKLEAQLELIQSGFNFVSTAYLLNGSVVQPPKNPLSHIDFLCNPSIGTSSVIVANSLLFKFRFTARRFSQDTELWAKLLQQGTTKYIGVSDPYVIYHPSSRTANKFVQLYNYLILLKDLEIGFFNFIKCAFFYSLNGILRHYLASS